ncbi:uncharacterized protein LOC119193132 [Manduca sexta]|uniref:uncharacterized protein LOC119193132 n=1 Tax=Manduca sexta TaxID=7130 RepID=UPI00188E54B9|nr:uncharacterized protein LOC119193132 [Manduca sexta]
MLVPQQQWSTDRCDICHHLAISDWTFNSRFYVKAMASSILGVPWRTGCNQRDLPHLRQGRSTLVDDVRKHGYPTDWKHGPLPTRETDSEKSKSKTEKEENEAKN